MNNFDFNNPTKDYVKKILKGIGEKENIETIDNCITRLRLKLKDISKVNEDILINQTGANKVIFIDENNIHIVYGLKINQIREAIDKEINEEKTNEGFIGNVNVRKILEGIGGKENIENIDNCITRLRLKLKNTSKVNEDILTSQTGASKVIFIDKNNIHIVYGVKIEEVRKAIEEEINK